MFSPTLNATIAQEIYTKILSFSDNKAQLNLSETCHKLYDLTNIFRQTLFVSVPNSVHHHITDPSILKNVLARFPNLTTLYLGATGSRLSLYEDFIIKPVGKFLINSFPKKLRHLKISELEGNLKACIIEKDKKDGKTKDVTIEKATLNREYLKAWSHSQLLSLEIIATSRYRCSTITGVVVNDVLHKSKNLTSFTLCQPINDSSIEPLEIQLHECLNLQKLTLRASEVTLATVESLKKCRHLTELDVTSNTQSRTFVDLENFLCSNHGLNLRILNLKFPNHLLLTRNLEVFTRFNPNLRHFSNLPTLSSLAMRFITNDGLQLLSSHCRSLTSLKLDFVSITNDGLIQFSKSAVGLKKLWIINAQYINQLGLLTLINSCSELEDLTLEDFRDLNREILMNFGMRKNLKNFSLFRCSLKNIEFKDLNDFIDACKSLKHFSLSKCLDLSRTEFLSLTEPYPRVRSLFPEFLKKHDLVELFL